MSLFSAPLFSTSFVIYMKGLVDKSLSSQNGQIPNFIFHARKEFVIITSPGQDGIRELVLGWTCTIERHLVLRRYVLMAEWLCISHARPLFFYVGINECMALISSTTEWGAQQQSTQSKEE